MAEVNQDLVQQLEQNLASFEAAGLTEDAEAIKAKLAKVQGGKATTAKVTTAKTTRKYTRKTTAKKGKE
jgi:hypothetical protein